jgi:hypothetical protein
MNRLTQHGKFCMNSNCLAKLSKAFDISNRLLVAVRNRGPFGAFS